MQDREIQNGGKLTVRDFDKPRFSVTKERLHALL